VPKNMYVDVSGWKKKYGYVMHEMAPAIKRAVDEGMDILMMQTIDNVTGDAYGSRKGPRGGVVWHRGAMTNSGKLPVTVRTGTLRRSVKGIRPHDYLGAVYSDLTVAPYAPYVHDGTKYLRPRRFLGEAVRGKKQSINDRFTVAIKNVIRKANKIG